VLEEAVVLPYVHIGRGARLKKVVIDRGVRIPEGLVVGEDPELDAKRFRRTESGVCLITQPMIDRLAMMKVLSVASEIYPAGQDRRAGRRDGRAARRARRAGRRDADLCPAIRR
jgi:hypothetical protein